MNIKRVFKDYEWHPSMGDYHNYAADERPKLKEKKKKNVVGKISISITLILIIILLKIFLF